MTMRHYLVLPRRDVPHADSYWVLAPSGEEARRLVAQNVPGASGAADHGEFECVLNDQTRPPPGFIYTQVDHIYVTP